MPELPEVETTRRGIAPWLEGARIDAVEIRQPKLRWPVPAHLAQWLPGQRIGVLQRRAKYLLLPLLQEGQQVSGHGLIWHLGMSGSLRLVEAHTPWKKHDHIELRLQPQAGQPVKYLRYHDPRRFGLLLDYLGDPLQHSLLLHLGSEPLSDAFQADYLYRLACKRSQPVKQLIMEQKVVVGVGNIYANEALFRAGIDPRRAANKISLARYQMLVTAIREILSQAIEQGGTTLKDFVQSDGQPGYFVQQLQVYGRAGQPCPQCAQPLKSLMLGQRNTFFCNHCQH